MVGAKALAAAILFCAFLLLCESGRAGVCEKALTSDEISADRTRAAEFFGATTEVTNFGYCVNAAGDLNGDGFDDVALAAPLEGNFSGAVYIVFGRSAAAWENAKFDFNASGTPDPASWIRISGTIVGNSNSFLGYYGIAPGDFNGDGLGDLVVGTNLGDAIVVFGRSGAWSSFSIADFPSDTVQGFRIFEKDSAQTYVGNAGDMNGDGIEDVLVSPIFLNKSFVVFGAPGTNRSDFDLTLVDGANGFALSDGTSGIGQGVSMGSAGDVNGDGLGDLALVSPSANNNKGCAYVVFAHNVSATGLQWATLLNLALEDASVFVLNGPANGTALGSAVVGAGDINADGYDDVFIGSYYSQTGAWVVFGHSAPWTSLLNLSQLDGANGFHFAGTGDYLGFSGGGTGDINGDGIDDLVLGGSRTIDAIVKNTALVVYGHRGSWPAELSSNTISVSTGFFIDNPQVGSNFGFSTRGAGDVNNDGLFDVLLGAYFYGSSRGYAALAFGFNDHCAVCSNASEVCLTCDAGFISSNNACIAAGAESSSSTMAVIVVIETNGGSLSEVAADCAVAGRGCGPDQHRRDHARHIRGHCNQRGSRTAARHPRRAVHRRRCCKRRPAVNSLEMM